MPGAVLERPKLTRAMYQALKKHIIKEREKKKQELEQDEQLERMRKEQELRKKKEKEDSLTLEQTKEQIQQLEKKLEGLKQEKHELFSQLKKVLHQEDETRKRAQIKEQQSEMLSIQQAYPSHIPVSSHSMLSMQSVSGRPTLYRPQQPMIPQMAIKRPHSPSPPPSSVYQQYPESKMIQPTPPKQHSPYTHPAQSDYKATNFPGHSQATQVTYATKPSAHNFQQTSGIYSGNKSPGKSYPASQSAFTSYPNHYPHQQQKQIPESYPGYPRVQQQAGYIAQSHGSLQQQLEHANQKAGFNEENKYKIQQQQQIRGVTPISAQTQGLMHQQIQLQQPQQKGSIVTGFSARGQAPPPSTAYNQPQSQNYPTQQASQIRQTSQMTGQPMTGQPMTAQPMTGQPMTAQPMTGQPMTAQPITGQPMTGQPMTAQPMGGQHGGRAYY